MACIWCITSRDSRWSRTFPQPHCSQWHSWAWRPTNKIMFHLQNDTKILIHLRGLPYKNRQTNAVLKGLLGGVVKVFEPKVEDLFLRLLVLLATNSEPLDQGDVANGGLQIPVWRFQSEHTLAGLRKRSLAQRPWNGYSLLGVTHRNGFAVVLSQNRYFKVGCHIPVVF